MRPRFLFLLGALVGAAGLLAGYGYPAADPSVNIQSSREDAYRANNIGVALLEQFNHKEAAVEFRRALRIDPSYTVARVNLGIALYNTPDVDGAAREMKTAAGLLPGIPQVHYMLGLIARAQNRTDEAIAAFQEAQRIDPRDPAIKVNLGQLFLQQRKYPEAIEVLRSAIASEPYNVTATYSLAMSLIRSGKAQEGQAMMKTFQELREKPYAKVLGKDYLEQGQYAEAIASTGAEAELVDAGTPEVTFTEATSSVLTTAPAPEPRDLNENLWRSLKAAGIDDELKRQILAISGGVVAFDFDNDDDMDLLDVGLQGLQLFRNDSGKLVDVSKQSGLPQSTAASSVTAVAGDYDNDGRSDVVVLGFGRLMLYHNDGNGKFSDATATARLNDYPYISVSAAMVDVDHDGDLDIFVAGFADLSKTTGQPNQKRVFPDDFPGAPNLLLRNDGNGRFSDITAAAKIGESGRGVAVVPTDFDNRRDIDLLVVNYGGAPTLYKNQRDGTFRDVAAEVGLSDKSRFTCVAAGDVNKDDFTDFFLGRLDGPGLFAMSDGKGRFVATPAPSGTEAPTRSQFLDYDNDGLLDLVIVAGKSARVFRNLGSRWNDVSGRAISPDLLKEDFARCTSADMDGDGDTDLITRLTTGNLKVARNEGGNKNRSVRVQLTSRVSNRGAVGAKIEARAGSLKQKLESYAATPAPAPSDIIFGLGKRGGADAIRLLWPAGIVQAETGASVAATTRSLASSLKITELDRKPSSCPYLYAWNGERFGFLTDFLGGGEMGYWVAPGVRNTPDPDEYVRISDDQLKPREGRFELRVTNELEETVYLDRVQMVAISHPADTEVYPNEGMTYPPRPFRLFATRGAHPPAAAVDDHGHDVLSHIERIDRRYPDDFALRRIRGYAEDHTLTLDLGEPSTTRTLLLLTGWTDYAFSSDNVAASQSGLSLAPPKLQVRDEQGRWRTAIADIGIPVGRPQTIVVDLTGIFTSRNREIRIVTNMRIYWDQILVDTSPEGAPMRMTRINPASADLRWRGFSVETTPDGREPFGYDYDRVSATSPWKTMAGRYTREGDVLELLTRTDDMFVVSKPGDEIALSFDAKNPPLPAGWKRTYLFFADGFSKEMDINSVSPDRVEPLPFHAMKSYPASIYPAARRRREYIERYNTRVVASPVPRIETSFALENR